MTAIQALIAVRPEAADRFRTHFAAKASDFSIKLVPTADAVLVELTKTSAQAVDVLILDNALDRAFDFITHLRHTYPRLILVLVDEEADFATPGQADDISTEPFDNDDLARRIKRLMADRQMETLRADAMPPVREFARLLRKATGEIGKQQAAVSACRSMGFDYVAYYQIKSRDPLIIEVTAEDGLPAILDIAPRHASAEDIVGWVAQTGHSRTAGPSDEPTHPLVRRGRLGAVTCVAVGRTSRYGVLAALRDQPDSISQHQVMMIELISAQLAVDIARD